MAKKKQPAAQDAAGGPVTPIERWKLEIQAAQKAQNDWLERGKKIVKRYRDERDSASQNKRMFALLWSNVQTLTPALYSQPPKMAVSRRWNDRDVVGRVAALMIERAVSYELEKYDIGAMMRPAVQDRLLPGRGTSWVRYEPHLASSMQDVELKRRGDFVESEGVSLSDNAEYYDGQGDAYEGPEPAEKDGKLIGQRMVEEKAWECTPTDYVYWQDWLCSPARTWEEVRWVARRTFPSREELVARFGEEVAAKIPLNQRPSGFDEKHPAAEQLQRGEVWEVWNKPDRMVRWMAVGCGDLLDERDDPLKVEGFFPCPKPLFATLTNGSMVPVPDYAEYQDQAMEIDDLTDRIASLQKALKVVGVYDKANPQLQRILNEGVENTLIAVDAWAAFAEKGGIRGQIEFLDIATIANVLQGLYQARSQVINDVYQITGMADIVRGATDPNETATAQAIKGKYANLRLSDVQMEVERFARDTIRIKAEIMCEHYSAETLIQISGVQQLPEFQPPKELQNVQPPGPPPQIPPGSDPQQAQQAMGQYQQAMQAYAQKQQALTQWQQQAQQLVQEAVALLKDTKLRDLRLDIETRSMVQMDEEAERETRTQFLAAISAFLQQAGGFVKEVPQSAELMGAFLEFAVRAFPVGREMESVIDRFVQGMQQVGQQPQQDPKAQEQAQKAQEQMQRKGEELQGREVKVAKAEADLTARDAKLKAGEEAMSLRAENASLKVENDRLKAAQAMEEKAKALQERLQAIVSRPDEPGAELEEPGEVDGGEEGAQAAITPGTKALIDAVTSSNAAVMQGIQALVQAVLAPRKRVGKRMPDGSVQIEEVGGG